MELAQIIRVARGDEPADTLLKNRGDIIEPTLTTQLNCAIVVHIKRCCGDDPNDG